MDRPTQQRELTEQDICGLGYDRAFAQRVLQLLSQQTLLQRYLQAAEDSGVQAITRISRDYPGILHHRWGADAPGCLWAKGDVSLLQKKAVALVGSRQLHRENSEFARQAGMQIAKQGYVLVSGNALGADRTAQESCLEHGGQVICVVADELQAHTPQEHVLYLSEDSFDLPFSAQRALSRNRVIHGLGCITLVAQCGATGGTWDGTMKNLQKRISPVFCFRDDSAPMQALCDAGAKAITAEDLADLAALKPDTVSLIDQ